MQTAQKMKYAGGYNGDLNSVSGYEVSAQHYLINSKNSITAEVVAVDEIDVDQRLQSFNVSMFRKNEFLFSYIYKLDQKTRGSSHYFSLVDNIAVNILFQLNEQELDKLLPMIQNSSDHSFSFDSKIDRYYIHCKSSHPCIDEFIIKRFNNKFYYDECSFYQKNMSMYKMLKDYSHFAVIEMSHSLSDNDIYFSLSGFYATWVLSYDSKNNIVNYIMRNKNPETLGSLDNENIPPISKLTVLNEQDFYDTTFNLVIQHICSYSYITNNLSDLINDYNIDTSQDWSDIVKLFDMATI